MRILLTIVGFMLGTTLACSESPLEESPVLISDSIQETEQLPDGTWLTSIQGKHEPKDPDSLEIIKWTRYRLTIPKDAVILDERYSAASWAFKPREEDCLKHPNERKLKPCSLKDDCAVSYAAWRLRKVSESGNQKTISAEFRNWSTCYQRLCRMEIHWQSPPSPDSEK